MEEYEEREERAREGKTGWRSMRGRRGKERGRSGWSRRGKEREESVGSMRGRGGTTCKCCKCGFTCHICNIDTLIQIAHTFSSLGAV